MCIRDRIEDVTSPHGVLLHSFLEASSLVPISTFAASGQSSTFVFGAVHRRLDYMLSSSELVSSV
eukprot:4064858-Prorocentrum_lima.AAC.1